MTASLTVKHAYTIQSRIPRTGPDSTMTQKDIWCESGKNRIQQRGPWDQNRRAKLQVVMP
jgi:hypothetical protein